MSSPIRVCLVGAGRAGKVHANSLVRHLPEGRLVAIVDSSEEMLRDTGSAVGVEEAMLFSSLEVALDRADFDAVVITTPTFTHQALAVMAAQGGKHVFLEKPMALSLAECDAIIDAAHSSQVLLQLGFMRRFDPDFAAAASRIEAGEIGRPMMIKSLTHGPGLPPPWARDLKTSNGMLAEVNSHDWDCVRWLMKSNYERVYVETANFKGPANQVDTPNFYDNVLVNIRFESGEPGQHFWDLPLPVRV
jgi:predicted dehydrogenase